MSEATPGGAIPPVRPCCAPGCGNVGRINGGHGFKGGYVCPDCWCNVNGSCTRVGLEHDPDHGCYAMVGGMTAALLSGHQLELF